MCGFDVCHFLSRGFSGKVVHTVPCNRKHISLFGHVARLVGNTPVHWSLWHQINISRMASWHYWKTSSRSPKKHMAGSNSLWQHPTAHWFMEICYPSRLFWGDAVVPADDSNIGRSVVLLSGWEGLVSNVTLATCYRLTGIQAYGLRDLLEKRYAGLQHSLHLCRRWAGVWHWHIYICVTAEYWCYWCLNWIYITYNNVFIDMPWWTV